MDPDMLSDNLLFSGRIINSQRIIEE